MDNFKNRIKKISTTSSNWKEKALHRKNNRWLLYSSQIARRIISVIDGDKDLSQVKLAQSLNVTPQHVNKILKGHENLTLETIYKLSQALGVELISFPEYKWSVVQRKNETTSNFSIQIPLLRKIQKDQEGNLIDGKEIMNTYKNNSETKESVVSAVKERTTAISNGSVAAA